MSLLFRSLYLLHRLYHPDHFSPSRLEIPLCPILLHFLLYMLLCIRSCLHYLFLHLLFLVTQLPVLLYHLSANSILLHCHHMHKYGYDIFHTHYYDCFFLPTVYMCLRFCLEHTILYHPASSSLSRLAFLFLLFFHQDHLL